MVICCTLVAVGFAIAGANRFEDGAARIIRVNAGFVFTGRNGLSVKKIAPRK